MPCRRNVGLRFSGILKFRGIHLDSIKTFAFLKYAIVCVPLEKPKILFVRHYRAGSDRWRTYNLCAACCRDYTPSIRQFVNICTVPILTLPTQILANLISIYVNHLLSMIWLHICLPSHFQFNWVPTYRPNAVSPVYSRGYLTFRSRT